MSHSQDHFFWFNHIYQSHHSALMTWFSNKLNHSYHAEDLSHEVFYRILKTGHHLEHINEPKAWLLGIAKHVVIDYWRRQHIEKLYLEAIASLPENFYPSVEHELCIRETIYQIHCILEALPKRVSEIFLMSQLDGMTYSAIAKVFDISEITVKRDMKQAFLACMHLYDVD